jgi:hypothetical protein|tara:strand:+ start:819 stop:1013 length:195 start_codon:yes stop_codon:yes gene_type:complete
MKLEKPRGATHARIVTPEKKKSIASIKDIDVFVGTTGVITWLKETRGNTFKELGSIAFDGELET